MRCRHQDFFLALVEQAEPELRGPEHEQGCVRLKRDHDNLRRALEWCPASPLSSISVRTRHSHSRNPTVPARAACRAPMRRERRFPEAECASGANGRRDEPGLPQQIQHQMLLTGPGADHVKAACWLVGSCDPRKHLQSIAIRWALYSDRSLSKRVKHAPSCWGLSREKTRAKVSWLGMPLGRASHCLRAACLLRSYSAISIRLWAPQSMAHRATRRMSLSRWRLALPQRGSDTSEK
jgi:hypothetical protein